MNRSENVKRWRRRTKERLVKSFSNICACCKQTYPPEVFDFHHLKPEEKEFQIASVLATCCSWEKIVKEVRKCVMLCANCHRLVEHTKFEIPNDSLRFNEDFAEYRVIKKYFQDKCPVCDELKSIKQITCSLSCSGKRSRKVDWDNIDVIQLYDEHKNFEKIGRMLGVSGNSIIKRYKKVISRCVV